MQENVYMPFNYKKVKSQYQLVEINLHAFNLNTIKLLTELLIRYVETALQNMCSFLI